MTIAYTSGKNTNSKSIPDVIPTYVQRQTYQRPADWATLPTVTTTDQKFVGLVAVTNDDSNYLSLMGNTSVGNYQVDWGDGTIETFGGGVQANHQYTYSTLAGSPTTRGYKQAIVVVTALTGNLIAIDLNLRHPTLTTTGNHTVTAKWLELVIGSPYIGTLTVSPATKNVQLSMVESIQIRSVASGCSFAQGFRELYALQKFVFPATQPTQSSYAGMFANDYSLYDINDVTTMNFTVNGNFTDMFNGCRSLKVAPYLDMVNVTNTTGMLANCPSLVSIPSYNTSNVTIMTSMFSGCSSLESVPWMDTRNVQYMDSMFINCVTLKYVPQFNTSNLLNCSSMFSGCNLLTSVPLMDLSKVTTIASMFANCYSLRTIPQFDTGNVTNFSGAFSTCRSLNNVPLLNTIKATDMSNMFSSCYELTTVPLFNTANNTSFSSTFNTCYSLQSVPLFDMTNNLAVTNMFVNCYNLKTVPLFDTSKCTSHQAMFNGCTSLTEVPLLNTSNSTVTTNMFSGCSSLLTIPQIDTTKVTTVTSMFLNCVNLNSIPSLNFANAVTGTTSVTSGCQTLASVLPTGLKTAFTVSGTNLSKNALENMMDSLGIAATTQVLTITSNFGADTPISPTLTAGQAAGVSALTVNSTTGLVAGMWVTNAVCFAAIACTFQQAAATVTKTAHGLANGTRVSFPSVVTTTGININQIYYVVNRTADTFQLALTSGGAPISFATGNGTGTMKYEVYIVSVTSGTTFSISAPTTAITTATAIPARYLNTYKSTLKNWSVTG